MVLAHPFHPFWLHSGDPFNIIYPFFFVAASLAIADYFFLFLFFLSYVCVWMRVFVLPPVLYLLCYLIKMIGIDPNKDEVILNARTDDITTSYLIIQKADVSDTGKYTCAPSNSAPTSINVHVLHGKGPTGHFLEYFCSLNGIYIVFCFRCLFLYSCIQVESSWVYLFLLVFLNLCVLHAFFVCQLISFSLLLFCVFYELNVCVCAR